MAITPLPAAPSRNDTPENFANKANTFLAALPTMVEQINSGTIYVPNSGDQQQFPPGSASAPSISTTGDTNTGIYFPADGSIALVSNGVEKLRINSDYVSTNKNYIINGNFGINQRAVSDTVTLSAGAYGHDRWKAGASGCTYTFATSNGVTTLTISAGSLQQVIEGDNVRNATVCMSWSGTAQGKIAAGAYSATGVTASVTGGSNLTVEFNTGTLSQVQLEEGSVATNFEYRPIGEELALCQRYYHTLYIDDRTITNVGDTIRTYPISPNMRAAPALTFVDAAGTTTAIGSDTIGTVNALARRTTPTSYGGWYWSATTAKMDAEL